jgi:hypothetical protein
MIRNVRWNKFIKLFFGLGLLFTSVHSATAEEAPNQDEWQFMGELYLWAPGLKSDLTNGASLDLSFKDILENIDMVFMGTLGASKGKLKFFSDIIYLDMSADEDGKVDTPFANLTVNDKLDVGMKAWIVQPTAAYTIFETPKSNIDLAVGARYLWIETDLKLRVTGPLDTRQFKTTVSGHTWDGIVGFKGDMQLSNKWGAEAYIDGGTGDSDYTWQALAGLNYKFDTFTGRFGYRHLEWKFDDGALEDLKISGPYAGARFAF